jgi:hypothetical protein
MTGIAAREVKELQFFFSFFCYEAKHQQQNFSFVFMWSTLTQQMFIIFLPSDSFFARLSSTTSARSAIKPRARVC